MHFEGLSSEHEIDRQNRNETADAPEINAAVKGKGAGVFPLSFYPFTLQPFRPIRVHLCSSAVSLFFGCELSLCLLPSASEKFHQAGEPNGD
jgi:hypothetical protein